ncbi:hypothetical protein Nepgr_010414 [Nepenthes gracilis]|uniref:Uncharacterized protein n=1 Tax=Nepenthes gracilis TaxID=150966 RepID=A0AAD3SCW2_NEPGR|nr:hypothetical protein Nepgr_010414 [Nepenthes gracilis]
MTTSFPILNIRPCVSCSPPPQMVRRLPEKAAEFTSSASSLGLPLRLNRCPGSRLMASSQTDAQSTFSPNRSSSSLPIQLDEESDFEKILSPDGYISICGFGSLLSERSARSTFPDLVNFRIARLKGFRRVFAHVAPIFFERGIAKPETKEVSSLSVEPCEDETLIVTAFEIRKSEIPSFIRRELEFRFLAVFLETLDGKPFTNRSVLCARYTDEEFFNVKCKGSKETYFQLYGQYNIGKIWRDDILPCRAYLRHCVLASKNIGCVAYNNFLDHTYLGDRKTTIREYLETTGSGIMGEEPPESLKTRYGG